MSRGLRLRGLGCRSRPPRGEGPKSLGCRQPPGLPALARGALHLPLTVGAQRSPLTEAELALVDPFSKKVQAPGLPTWVSRPQASREPWATDGQEEAEAGGPPSPSEPRCRAPHPGPADEEAGAHPRTCGPPSPVHMAASGPQGSIPCLPGRVKAAEYPRRVEEILRLQLSQLPLREGMTLPRDPAPALRPPASPLPDLALSANLETPGPFLYVTRPRMGKIINSKLPFKTH